MSRALHQWNIQDVEFVICPYCNKQMDVIHWHHLKIHNKSVQELIKEFPDIPKMTKKYSDFLVDRRKKCEEKITKTCIEKYGGVGVASKSLKEKTTLSIVDKYGVDNVMKVTSISEKFKGDKNPAKRPEVREKLSKARRGRPSKLKGKSYEEILGPERAESRREEQRHFGAIGMSVCGILSKPQKELYEIVKQIEPDSVLEYPFRGYCIDIAILDKKIAIEYDGSYWHNETRDQEKDKVLEEFGWKVYRFKDRVPTYDELIHIIKK